MRVEHHQRFEEGDFTANDAAGAEVSVFRRRAAMSGSSSTCSTAAMNRVGPL